MVAQGTQLGDFSQAKIHSNNTGISGMMFSLKNVLLHIVLRRLNNKLHEPTTIVLFRVPCNRISPRKEPH